MSSVCSPVEHNRHMPAPLIRRAVLADADAIGLVHVRSWQSAYRGKIPQDYLDGLDPIRSSHVWRQIMDDADSSRGGVLVAVAEGGRITGFTNVGPSRDDADPLTGEVYAIYAAPDAWGTGTGRALMGEAVTELARLGYAEAVLWVLDGNERARRFYALAGWEEDGASKTDGSRGFDITKVCYRRTLDGCA